MKAKLPKLILRRKKLRAATARRSSHGSAGMDYGDMAEPNMKLSRALLVVLLLHVVAVSGIIAFNAIKMRQSSFPPPTLGKTENELPASMESPINDNASNPKAAVVPRNESKTSHPVSKHVAKDDREKPIQDEKTHVPSGKIYTVVKGDNPVTIARKLEVPYVDLMEINHIEDPRKLQIGQKLLIPKITKQKKGEK